MRAKRPLFLLVLGVMLAASAAWAAHGWLSEQARPKEIPTVTVAAAAVDLGAGEKIAPHQIVLQEWPASKAVKGSFRLAEEVVGRVVMSPMVKGEVILKSKLGEIGMAGGLSAVVPEGYRAMTVKVDEVIGVGGFVQPGDRVDVLVTLNRGDFSKNPASAVVLQNILVLTAGKKIIQSRKADQPHPETVSVVTLQVTLEQGEKLALSAGEGKVILALRNQGEKAQYATDGVRLNSLVPAPSIAPAPVVPEEEPKVAKKPSRSKKRRYVMEVLRGTKLTVQTF